MISAKWVLKKKVRADNTVERYKARLVARGFDQKHGIDYFDTSASVMRYTTLRILLAHAAAKDLEVDQMDINTAFLIPKLEEEVYLEIPQFLEVEPLLKTSKKPAYLELLKSLYGLKQAPRAWFNEVQTYFKGIGLQQSTADPNLFLRDNLRLLLFVDDMLIVGERAAVNFAKKQIASKWSAKDLGVAETFVGFQIQVD